MNSKLTLLIKITSTILITSALSLEIWNVFLHFDNRALPTKLNPALWLATVALIGHGIEGCIAAFNANSHAKNPWTYGVYTFFVGFVGLRELSDRTSK